MKRTVKLLVLSFCFALFVVGNVSADAILGCPKGISQGTIWPMITFSSIDGTKKWNSVSEKMVGITNGAGIQGKSVKIVGLRLGYGVMDHLQVGLKLDYAIAFLKKKTKSGKILSYTGNNLSDLWLGAQYIFLDLSDKGAFDYLKFSVGAGYGFSLSDDSNSVLSGVSTGADQAKAGFLTHGGIKGAKKGEYLFEFAGHILYHYKGIAATVSGYSRSGQDLPDTLDYMFGIEKSLFNYFELKLGTSGWIGMKKDPLLKDSAGNTLIGYSHSIMIGTAFLFSGEEYDKRKLMLKVLIPYSARAMVGADFKLMGVLSYTF